MKNKYVFLIWLSLACLALTPPVLSKNTPVGKPPDATATTNSAQDDSNPSDPISILYDFSCLSGTDCAGVGRPNNNSLTLSGSTLYGMTELGGDAAPYSPEGYGAIFSINTDGAQYQTLHSWKQFEGLPSGSLTLSGSTLYGMAEASVEGHGMIFSIATSGAGYQVLHNFTGGANDGVLPLGSLTLSGSTLYGMTAYGGSGPCDYGCGVIFSINTDGSGFQVIHSFTQADGEGPYGDLTLSGSTLYGMTTYGGNNSCSTGSGANTFYGCGVIFSINTDGSEFQVMRSFANGDGSFPCGSLTLSGSTLYGMTTQEAMTAQEGWGAGDIFSINTDGSGFQALYSFANTAIDGASPRGSPTLSGSTLYGMTMSAGAYGNGTIFSISVLPVNAVCGSSNGGTFTSAPTTNLCSTGTPSTVSGSDPWFWTCQGVNGGTNASCSANVHGVNGVCGSSNGVTFTSAPTSNLCNAGTPSTVSGSGPWLWGCQGVNGGSSASCSAKVQLQGVNGVCGSANGEDLLKAPKSNLCSTGKASKVTGKGPWDWTCSGSDGGSTASCSANLEINGACGSANGKDYLTPPMSNLCKSGAPSSVSNNELWEWTCAGSNGGATASCSAKIEINGACGLANKESFLTEPTTNLCSAGNPSTVKGKGPWKWTCTGSNGGSKASCSANLEK